MPDIVYAEESYAIIGACFNVYNDKGCGFLEPVYQECLGIEFEHLGIPSDAEVELRLKYRGRQLKHFYKADFLYHGKILVELKAVRELTGEHRAQLLNYLNATGFELGLLVNFGQYPDLQHERMVLNDVRATDEF
ncbi:MAG: GxxExxY protein [Verrucomicrobia bacterium]|nr:GxxExxY protein [Verrucomicrobiota bacterium]